MTVRTVLIAGAITFFSLLAAAFATTLLLLGDDSGGARTVGLTNRQGLLSQKVAKEALAYARQPSPEALAELRETMQLFSVTHRALRFGGSAPLDFDGAEFGHLAGARDPELQRLLEASAESWDKIAGAIELLIRAAQRRREALLQVELKNPRLMRKLQEVSEALTKMNRVRATVAISRQSVLAERTAKEAFLFDLNPTEEVRGRLDASIAAFETGHQSLRKRFNRRRGPDADRLETEAADRLDEAGWLWIDQSEAALSLASDRYDRSVAAITETSPRLMSTLSAAAVRADWVAARNIRRLQTIQLFVLALGVLIAGAAIVFAVQMGSSLRRLRDTAEEISRGHVDTPVGVFGLGEVRDLCRSFERMRISLGKAIELVDRASGGALAARRSDGPRADSGRRS